MDDPFVKDLNPDEIDSAGEFLTSWLPFLTRDLCSYCSETLTSRVRSLRPDPTPPTPYPDPSGWDSPDPDPDPHPVSPKARMSWADMAAQEDELEQAEGEGDGDVDGEGEKKKVELPREQREWIRFNSVKRKKDFICLERIRGRLVNILDGLELHTGVFSAAEQKRIVDLVYQLQEKGKNSELRERTYSEPQKWMRGKGRVTIQFGCCYNYATDKSGNPPGILQNVASDPIPSLFKVIIKRLIRWHVLPPSCVPDSCIVNIYEPGDCIPPHIDSHDFVRPFCTVSFLSECNILFGHDLKATGAGEFSGSTAIPLPVGSVLVLNGNGADVAKHCVPAVPTKRISITFRKMDQSKLPFGFQPEPDLQNILPLQYDSITKQNPQRNTSKRLDVENKSFKRGRRPRRRPPGDTEHHPYEPQTPAIRPRQVIDARSASSSKSVSGRSFDPKLRLESQDVRLLQDDGRRPQHLRASEEGGPKLRLESQDVRLLQDDGRSPQHLRASVEGGRFEVGTESGARTVRLEQKRMIISRDLEQEE